MGLIHKLLPEIKAFILEQKKANSNLSCRELAALIEQKFQKKLSKSSINSILKSEGLSMPVGRRGRQPSLRGATEGGDEAISEIASSLATLAPRNDGFPTGTAEPKLLSAPAVEVNASAEQEGTGAILLKAMDALLGGREAVSLLRQLQGIKLTLNDASALYLDSQFHTAWPTPYFPENFSTTICNISSYIKKYLSQGQPMVLLLAPGEDAPARDLFSLIAAFNVQSDKINEVVLYGDKLEEFCHIPAAEFKQRPLIFGLLPAQFKDWRSIRRREEFKRYVCAPLQKELYLAQAEITLSQPHLNQMVTLKGCIVKAALSQEPSLIICTNNTFLHSNPFLLAQAYLDRWPEPQQAYADFSHKLEIFSYTGAGKGFSPTEKMNLKAYDELLDLYFRHFFLPDGFSGEPLYSLKCSLQEEKGSIIIRFQPPTEPSRQSALYYACLRLNERAVEFPGGRRAWFLSS